ncbi:MAG: polymerase protein [Candidatus Wolfebacteria bacterium GW2011_GWE1_48_7]|nr:MAG: polymerase protein [Candidatus Wolfebacteria bacterium GW2011_GWC1_47_103]KKU72780.1 MAG: polymerase protein [Candidatus Wolfebacteria bacterium GW2011_GWB1_47_243]KKU99353.1 MAG: polymerase protein [Candidatus Wolfebacteria bacterium GW2011_GWE1_48_7]
MHMKKLLLIDANALIHRAFHAIPNLTTPDGRPSGALYGLSNVLIKIFKEEHPEYAVAFFDRPEPTFRKELYDQYKAHRPKADDGLVAQIIEAHNLFDTFGVKTYEIPGFEGDDLIGTAIELFKHEKDIQIVILTGDKDMFQLIDDKRVVVETLKQGISETITYDQIAFEERYGFSPSLFVDYKGLTGDTSDNIPGVPKVGEVTALAIIKQFGTIESFFSAIKSSDATDKKMLSYKKLIEHEDIALLSKHLATIRRDAPLAITDISEIEYTQFPIETIISYLKDLGFNSIIKRLTPGEHAIRGTRPDARETQGQLSFLDNQQTLSKELLEDVERPLVPILEEMKQWGIMVDRTRLTEKEVVLNRDIDALTKELYAEAGQVFNPNSPKQILTILKTNYGLKIKSTNIDKIEPFRDTVPFVDLLLKYRELFKLKSTYLEPIKRMTDPSVEVAQGGDGRIHPTFVQMKAATGRITCENPNLQNIPPSVREIFVSQRGYKLVSLDYSQIELRILASLTEDPEMMRAFKSNSDIHQITASKIYNVSLNDVTPTMRKVAKTLNFGVIYGMGARALAQQSGLTPKEAKQFIDEYFKDFSTIKQWQDTILAKVREQGFVENINGRIRPLPEITSFNKMLQSEAERMAINFPIQSVGADIIKSSMVKIKEYLSAENLWGTDVKMLLTVHDELVFEIKDTDRLPKIVEEIKSVLESIYTLKVPLTVNVEIGDNWGEL